MRKGKKCLPNREAWQQRQVCLASLQFLQRCLRPDAAVIRPVSAAWLFQLPCQMRLDSRPFGGDDRIDGGIADGAIGHHNMRAQDAIKSGAEPFDRAPALVIDHMGAEFNGPAVQIFKGVAQQQQFAFRVQSGFLH